MKRIALVPTLIATIFLAAPASAPARFTNTAVTTPVLDLIDVIVRRREVIAIDPSTRGGTRRAPLMVGEKVLWSGARGKVAIVVTDRRLLGITTAHGSWRALRFKIHESEPHAILLGDRVALVLTSMRAIGLSSGGKGFAESLIGTTESPYDVVVGDNVRRLHHGPTCRRAVGLLPALRGAADRRTRGRGVHVDVAELRERRHPSADAGLPGNHGRLAGGARLASLSREGAVCGDSEGVQLETPPGRDSSDVTYGDILFEHEGDIAWITINREEKGNAFRIQTCREMIDAIETARRDPDCRSIVLTGAGERFFCLGGDHEAEHGAHGEQTEPDERFHYDNVFPVVDLYDLIDKAPKPVIAMVNGFAVGGGNVLANVCDLTIASSRAVFRQIGPSMGSFDAGFGTWYLEESVGRKRAKEIWYLNRKYSAEEARELGLVNEVVEPERLRERTVEVCGEISEKGAFAIAALKSAFHARHAGAPGLSRVALDMLTPPYYASEESKELGRAFQAKQSPDKSKFYR